MTIGLAVGLGVVIGVLLGLLGGGGSILTVPALVYLLGLPVEQAIPISLIVVGAAAAVGAVPRILAGQVQWRLAVVFGLAGVPAAIGGGLIARHLPAAVLMTGFATVMVVAGVRMLRDDGHAGTACRVGDGGIDWRRCVSRSVPAGLLVGLLTGVFGVGGGFLIVPALVLLLGVEMQIAVGTSLLVITANSGAGLLTHLDSAAIDWTLTAAFAGSAIACALIAGHLGARADIARLRIWFAYLVFAVAGYVLVESLVQSTV